MKAMNAVKRYGPTAAGVGAFAMTPMVFAQTAYDSITSAADWTDVSGGVVTIGAALALVLVTVTGVAILLGRVGRK